MADVVLWAIMRARPRRAGVYVAEWEARRLDLQAADLAESVRELQLLRPTRAVLARAPGPGFPPLSGGHWPLVC